MGVAITTPWACSTRPRAALRRGAVGRASSRSSAGRSRTSMASTVKPSPASLAPTCRASSELREVGEGLPEIVTIRDDMGANRQDRPRGDRSPSALYATHRWSPPRGPRKRPAAPPPTPTAPGRSARPRPAPSRRWSLGRAARGRRTASRSALTGSSRCAASTRPNSGACPSSAASSCASTACRRHTRRAPPTVTPAACAWWPARRRPFHCDRSDRLTIRPEPAEVLLGLAGEAPLDHLAQGREQVQLQGPLRGHEGGLDDLAVVDLDDDRLLQLELEDLDMLALALPVVPLVQGQPQLEGADLEARLLPQLAHGRVSPGLVAADVPARQ